VKRIMLPAGTVQALAERGGMLMVCLSVLNFEAAREL
jgi:hypothetical protein